MTNRPKQNPFELPRGYFEEDPEAGRFPGIEEHPPWKDDEGNDIDTGTRSTYNQQWRDYDMRGFWMYSTPIPSKSEPTCTRVHGGSTEGKISNPDYDLVARYLESHTVKGLQYDAYLLVVVQGLSISAAAQQLGIQRANLRQDLKRLRKKAERWASTQDSHLRMHEDGES